VIYADEARASLLAAVLPEPRVCVRSRSQLVSELAKRGAVAFVDVDLLPLLDGLQTQAPIIGIYDDNGSNTLASAVRALGKFSWLAHVVSTSMLRGPAAQSHLALLLERLISGPDMLGTYGVGRVARLAKASKREARFERIEEFFATHGLSARSIASIKEVAEELVMNALYDAPFEAGYFARAIPRTDDVDLPADRACEISYGIEGDSAFVRLRDTFGALSRDRLVDVLTRCNTDAVSLDESRGGAGLGLWRVFSSASTLSITVVPGQLTDIIVEFSIRDGRMLKHLHAMHLFFAPTKPNDMMDALVADDSRNVFDQSVTLVLVA